MLAKLMSRKKSYERMMRNGGEDGAAARSPQANNSVNMPDLTGSKSKPGGDMQMINNRGANGLSRAQPNNS